MTFTVQLISTLQGLAIGDVVWGDLGPFYVPFTQALRGTVVHKRPQSELVVIERTDDGENVMLPYHEIRGRK